MSVVAKKAIAAGADCCKPKGWHDVTYLKWHSSAGVIAYWLVWLIHSSGCDVLSVCFLSIYILTQWCGIQAGEDCTVVYDRYCFNAKQVIIVHPCMSVCIYACVHTVTGKLLIINQCHLVGILWSDSILMTFCLDLSSWHLFLYCTGGVRRGNWLNLVLIPAVDGSMLRVLP